MFGANEDLSRKEWFKDSLISAEMEFSLDNRKFVVSRYLTEINRNYIRYCDEENGEALRPEEYREKLNIIFGRNIEVLKELREYVEEAISYRTFTLFNFLGEKRQGVLNNFFDKCSKIEYAIKLPAILNYIFNENIAEINNLRRKAKELADQIGDIERQSRRNDLLRAKINQQLKVLGLRIAFSGTNSVDVLRAILKIQENLDKEESAENVPAITQLEAVYTSIDEQIKRQKNLEFDIKHFIDDNEKQVTLIQCLQNLTEEQTNYAYLTEPILDLIESLNKSISFNKYLIQESAVKALKEKREEVKQKIINSKARFTIYSASDKTKAITLIKEYLSYYNAELSEEREKELRRELREIRERLKYLQSGDDKEKLNKLSKSITTLYQSSTTVSDIAKDDFEKKGFQITYLKNGNLLQPQILNEDAEENQLINYDPGSMARHTLIQLCGYLSFLKMLINENRYPLIPLLVIDHISKPFDKNNQKAIGAVLESVYHDIDKSELQIIMFDDEDAEDLELVPDSNTNLIEKNKTGFNPFYINKDE